MMDLLYFKPFSSVVSLLLPRSSSRSSKLIFFSLAYRGVSYVHRYKFDILIIVICCNGAVVGKALILNNDGLMVG